MLILEKIGLYDENYINAYEHVDHSYKLAKEKYLTKIQSRGNSVVFTYDTNKFDNNSLSDIIKKYGN